MEISAKQIPQLALSVAIAGKAAIAIGVTWLEITDEGCKCAYIPVDQLDVPPQAKARVRHSVMCDPSAHWFLHKKGQRMDVYHVTKEAADRQVGMVQIQAAVLGARVRRAVRSVDAKATVLQGALRGHAARLTNLS